MKTSQRRSTARRAQQPNTCGRPSPNSCNRLSATERGRHRVRFLYAPLYLGSISIRNGIERLVGERTIQTHETVRIYLPRLSPRDRCDRPDTRGDAGEWLSRLRTVGRRGQLRDLIRSVSGPRPVRRLRLAARAVSMGATHTEYVAASARCCHPFYSNNCNDLHTDRTALVRSGVCSDLQCYYTSARAQR